MSFLKQLRQQPKSFRYKLLWLLTGLIMLPVLIIWFFSWKNYSFEGVQDQIDNLKTKSMEAVVQNQTIQSEGLVENQSQININLSQPKQEEEQVNYYYLPLENE